MKTTFIPTLPSPTILRVLSQPPDVVRQKAAKITDCIRLELLKAAQDGKRSLTFRVLHTPVTQFVVNQFDCANNWPRLATRIESNGTKRYVLRFEW